MKYGKLCVLLAFSFGFAAHAEVDNDAEYKETIRSTQREYIDLINSNKPVSKDTIRELYSSLRDVDKSSEEEQEATVFLIHELRKPEYVNYRDCYNKLFKGFVLELDGNLSPEEISKNREELSLCNALVGNFMVVTAMNFVEEACKKRAEESLKENDNETEAVAAFKAHGASEDATSCS